MPTFSNLLLVVAVAFAAPFILGLFPRLQLPSVVCATSLGSSRSSTATRS